MDGTNPHLLSTEELAQQLAMALDSSGDCTSIAEAINCIPECDPRRLQLGILFARAASVYESGAEEEFRDAEIQLKRALASLLQ